MKTDHLLRLMKLIRSAKRIGTVLDRKLEDKRVTITQWEAILCIFEAGQIRPIDLAQKTAVDRAATFRLVSILKRNGWVKQNPNPNDKKSYFLEMTPVGKKRISEISESLEKIAAPFMDGISKANQETLEGCLDRILENVREKES